MPYLSKELLSCPQSDFVIMDISAWPYFQLFHILPAATLEIYPTQLWELHTMSSKTQKQHA